MTISVPDLRYQIILPALKPFGIWSKKAEQLLLGTCAKESRLGTYLKQINGPALGIYQMEPSTHDDIWENYIKNKKEIYRLIIEIYGKADSERLIYDLRYATLMARIHYLRSRISIPELNDLIGQAKMWKKVYNTDLGKGTVDSYIEAYNLLIRDHY